MIKIVGQYLLVIFSFIALSTHLFKIIYLLFKPKILEKYPIFSNTKPSENYLLLYYLLTVLVTLATLMKYIF